ncbi:hypothetical protein [Nocardiopsis sp. RV163]|uniref:hypothetical protein n=1 Tax=Nocardiopsis sp. RV163 TaxID=1661388 RepID=UPI001F1B2DB0|nr:hypothetical protein [Nocardiopsis sp. RV163]
MVGRSTSITGPYRDRAGRAMTAGGGTEVLSGHGGVHGPGHQDVFADTGHDILACHYYADDGTALLGVNRLGRVSAGWPYAHWHRPRNAGRGPPIGGPLADLLFLCRDGGI